MIPGEEGAFLFLLVKKVRKSYLVKHRHGEMGDT